MRLTITAGKDPSFSWLVDSENTCEVRGCHRQEIAA